MANKRKPGESPDLPALVRSSAAEYLTFVAATGDSSKSVEMRYEDENIWLTQKMMAALYDVDVRTINEHLQKVFADGELVEDLATVRNFRIVQAEGERQVSRDIKHYNLQAIIAVGFKVNNPRAVQFRKWASQIVKDYTIQGWTMDVDRLKKGHLFTDEYFDRQQEVIREIRLSERKFYQKVTDLYATAFDYDSNAQTTREFFALVQNKLHMGLTSWEGAPRGKIVKSDVSIAKNYLSAEELDYLERIVSVYLDFGELQTVRKIPMTMADWAKRLDGFLEFNGNDILTGPGKISHEQAKLHAETEFEKYRMVQDRLFQSDFDRLLQEAEPLRIEAPGKPTRQRNKEGGSDASDQDALG
jgi:hypothetical protein